MMKNNNLSAGFSLIELMISLAILGVVLAGVTKVFVTTGKFNTSQEMMMEVQQNIRAAKHLMVDEIRSAACNPLREQRIGFEFDSSAETSDIMDTDADSIHFTRDIDNGDGDQLYEPDGKADEPNEDLAYYRLDDTDTIMNWNDNRPGTLYRNTASARQPLADDITALHFQYFNANNSEILPAYLTNNTQLDTIKTVQITITGQVQNTARVSSANQTWTQQFMILVRNQ